MLEKTREGVLFTLYIVFYSILTPAMRFAESMKVFTLYIVATLIVARLAYVFGHFTAFAIPLAAVIVYFLYAVYCGVRYFGEIYMMGMMDFIERFD